MSHDTLEFPRPQFVSIERYWSAVLIEGSVGKLAISLPSRHGERSLVYEREKPPDILR